MAEKKSSYNEKHNRYTQDYIRKKYDQIVLRLPKEGREGVITRDMIIEVAQKSGESVNSYIIEAVKRRMGADVQSSSGNQVS